jgi:hypothetical protein
MKTDRGSAISDVTTFRSAEEDKARFDSGTGSPTGWTAPLINNASTVSAASKLRFRDLERTSGEGQGECSRPWNGLSAPTSKRVMVGVSKSRDN